MDIDYLYYICTALLGWTEEQFLYSSLKHIMKQIDIHVKINSPKGNKEESSNFKNGYNKSNNQITESFDVLD